MGRLKKDARGLREIVYANLKVRHKGKIVKLERVVYKENDDLTYTNHRVLGDYKIKEPVEVVDVEVITSLGYENGKQGYSLGVKNDNMTRNAITGAYE